MTNKELDELEQRAELDRATMLSGEPLKQLIALARHATGRTHTETCAHCLRPALRLCDWPLFDGKGIMTGKTCDVPLCLEHATQQGGTIFICGTKDGCITDSHDFCPEHEAKRQRLTPDDQAGA